MTLASERVRQLRSLIEEVKVKSKSRQLTYRTGDSPVLFALGNWERKSRYNAEAVAAICDSDKPIAEAADLQLRAMLELVANVFAVVKDDEPQLMAQTAIASQILQLEEQVNEVASMRGVVDLGPRLATRKQFREVYERLDPEAMKRARAWAKQKRGHWSRLTREKLARRAGIDPRVYGLLWGKLSIAGHEMGVATNHVRAGDSPTPGTSMLYFEMEDSEAEAYRSRALLTAGKLLTDLHRGVADYFDLPYVSFSMT